MSSQTRLVKREEELSRMLIMSPDYSSIFKRIRQEAGLEALKLARTMEKTSYKLEAHYRRLHFSHKALEQQWIPKSLRFKPPGSHPIFKRIMERTSIKHCLRARISICHSQIQSLKKSSNQRYRRYLAITRLTSWFINLPLLRSRGN